MEGKWTKGDWGVRERTHVVRSVRECESLGPGIGAGVSYVPVAKAYGETEAETKANARLIAQAPAMATKLEATHQYLREQGHDEMADEIEALLTAIKGE